MIKGFRFVLIFAIIAALTIPSFMTVAPIVPATAESTTTPKPVEQLSAFGDVPSNHFAVEAIAKMNELGILTGYPDGSFRPSDPVKRVEFAVMMVKALKLEVTNGSKTTFEDLKNEKWAIPYVETAKNYLTGYKTATGIAFKPYAASVREDMAVALVKALKYPADSETILETYADASKISKDLRIYVASAIDNQLMVGTAEGDQAFFNPQKSLTRAEAAQLLMNVIREEKIIFDEQDIKDNKVVFGDDSKGEADEDSDEDLASTLKGTVQSDGTILLKWSKVDPNGFQGYKIVASITNKKPVYPENGYFQFITDYDTTNAIIKPGMKYSNGDFKTFEPGSSYYFSITTVYNNQKVRGNSVQITLPKQKVAVETPAPSAFALKATATEDGIKLQWAKAPEAGFQGYKVVASQKDGSPIYPDNGYKRYITDRSETSILIQPGDEYANGDFEQFESGETYYFAITYLMDQGKKSSNVVRLKLK